MSCQVKGRRSLQGNSVWRASLVAVLFAGVVVVSTSARATLLMPAGLNPGDTYHFAFATSTTRNAASTDIADYNAFVQAAADAAGVGSSEGVDWFVIGSTATVHARDNAVVGASSAVFLLNGTTKIADGFADMWDGTLDAPINLDENANGILPDAPPLFTLQPFTGSFASGHGVALRELGSLSSLGGADSVVVGHTQFATATWLGVGVTAGIFDNKSFYALSEELTVPGGEGGGEGGGGGGGGAVPEPTTYAMAAFGLIALGLFGWRRKRA